MSFDSRSKVSLLMVGNFSYSSQVLSDRHRPQVGRGAYEMKARSLFGRGTAALGEKGRNASGRLGVWQ
jgi:hypothetical protein